MFQQISEMPDFEELQPSQDPLLAEYLMRIAKSLEGETFSSKRKKEYESLIKQTIYSETLIRVKMPGNVIFEAKFSPMETIAKLYELVTDHLENKSIQFFLYMTPPVQKLTKKYLPMTFDDLQCVPNGLFYFGFENQTDESSLKILNVKDEIVLN